MKNVQQRPALSVVIPCYNEEENINQLMRRLSPICEEQFPGDYEIVLVNDGSCDHTWHQIDAYANGSRHVVGVDLSRNHGQQLALTAGLETCRGELIFILDADLQDPPELLGPMIEKLRNGQHDVVYGQRISRAGETLFKKASSSLFYYTLDRLTDVTVPPNTGDFRLMTRRVLEHFMAMPERVRFVRGMICWVGFSQVAFQYERDARFAGKTKYPLGKMISLGLDAVTAFSTLPLRLASHLGLLFGLCGIAALGWVMVSYLFFGTVRGWASLAALILIIGSVQMMMLGLFGEYLGRMYIESKRRPLYIIREVRRHPVVDRSNSEALPTEFVLLGEAG